MGNIPTTEQRKPSISPRRRGEPSGVSLPSPLLITEQEYTVNDMLADTIRKVNDEMARGFAGVWTRDDVDDLLEAFLDYRLTFVVDRNGIQILQAS